MQDWIVHIIVLATAGGLLYRMFRTRRPAATCARCDACGGAPQAPQVELRIAGRRSTDALR